MILTWAGTADITRARRNKSVVTFDRNQLLLLVEDGARIWAAIRLGSAGSTSIEGVTTRSRPTIWAILSAGYALTAPTKARTDSVFFMTLWVWSNLWEKLKADKVVRTGGWLRFI